MFVRFKKNKKLYISAVCVGIIVFLISYTVSVTSFKNSKDKEEGLLGDAAQTSFMKSNDILISDTSKIKFLLKYKNSLNSVDVSSNLEQPINVELDKLIGLNEEEAVKIFSNFGYKIERFTKEDVIFIKVIEGFNYKVDSYFIGIKDEYISIYKKELNGDIVVVEEKILNPKDYNNQSYLQVKDIEDRGNLLKSFYEGSEDYQFSNIQDAIEYAQALCST